MLQGSVIPSSRATPEGGRKKTKVEQVSPLTDRAREILQEIKAELESGA
jgi:hypothetical protein